MERSESTERREGKERGEGTERTEDGEGPDNSARTQRTECMLLQCSKVFTCCANLRYMRTIVRLILSIRAFSG
ncbi:hypothetical protein [Dactylosporangium sp. NPDC051541]|uniref:hypothetical protein n=1 Tax=Dactylosporangium sp. NPDC051541 TaxID=3363977 RepID=UPI0037A12760